jgi:hypothetical protein
VSKAGSPIAGGSAAAVQAPGQSAQCESSGRCVGNGDASAAAAFIEAVPSTEQMSLAPGNGTADACAASGATRRNASAMAANQAPKRRFMCAGVAGGRRVDGSSKTHHYMLRRYCPPTSNKALVICPSEQQRTACIRTSKTLRFSITAA